MKLDKNKVLKVIDKLKSVEHFANKEGMFDMSKELVQLNCDTPRCIAGWYVIAHKYSDYIQNLIRDGFCLKFNHGTELMARDLGFDRALQMVNYFTNHSHLWGNTYAMDMFNNIYKADDHENFTKPRAYNYGGFSGIIKHWQAVYDRL